MEEADPNVTKCGTALNRSRKRCQGDKLPPVTPFAKSFEAAAPDIAKGFRAAFATLVPFYLASRLGLSELAWMALGGWLGTLVDPGGLRATRGKTLAGFAVAGALTVTFAELCSGLGDATTAVFALSVFALTLLRALGATASTMGTMLAILMAVGISKGHGSYGRDGLFFMAGAAWAAFLSSIVWPVWTHLPVRRAVAVVFAELGAHAREVEACIDARVPEGDPQWSAIARQHHRAVRASLEAARAMAVALRQRRPGETRIGSNLRVLLGMAESQFLLLITLSFEIEALPVSARPSGDALAALAKSYDALHDQLFTRALRATAPSPTRARRTSLPAPPLSSPAPPSVIAEQLRGESRAALTLARNLDTSDDEREGDAADGAVASSSDTPASRVRVSARAVARDLRTLRDSLAPRSPFFRHAVRVALAAVVASAIGQRISTHPHWVTITTVVILQPYPGATVTRAIERVFGTVLGSLLAVAISMSVRSALGLAIVMVPLSVAAVAIKPRSYRMFTFLLTPVFVLLAERFHGDWRTAADRASDAIAGGGVALAAALVFPSWEKKRLPEALSGMLASIHAYAETVMSSFEDRGAAGAETRIADARRAAAIAIGEAETSLERLLAEPLRKASEAADAMQLVTYARRAASAVTALDTLADRVLAETVVTKDIPASAISAYLSGILGGAELFVHGGERTTIPPAPALPPTLDPHIHRALERILRQAALVASVSGRATV